MKTKLLSKKLNGLKFLLILSILMLGVSDAWASSYYTAFTATSSDTGKGLVYASGPKTSTAPANDEAYEASKGIGQSGDTGGSSKTNTYYAWAKAARGYAFDGWTTSASDGSSAVSGGCSTSQSGTASGAAFTVKSSVADKTVTGTATAKWKNDPNPYVVTFGVPVDGSYTMTYSYTVVKDGKFATEEKAYSMSESSTAASGQITSYAGDNVTVSTDASNFEGWYDNAGCTGNALSTSSSYSFQVSGATSIYAKFRSATKYYGKVAASIPDVPNSMPGGGTIYISNISGTTGATFSENAQEAKITTFNSDATPPASMSQTFYLHAKPNDKRYVFRGWFDNEAGTGTALSTNEDWEYTFAVSSHTEALPTTKTVYAIFDFKLYYMQVEIEPAIQGQGMVLASETKLTNPEYGLFSSESSVLTYALRAGASGTNDVYVYAKPKYGYKLAGWYSDPECKIAASVASDGKYTATGSSIYPMDPTIIKLYAKFVEESKINVTYNNPDHKKGEYKAYALDIAEINDEYVWSQVEIFSSIGKSANTVQSQYKTDVLILSAEAISGYGVTSWTDGSTTKTTPSQIYNTTATAAKMVGVTFGDAKPFMVKASGTYYSSFSEALAAVGNSGQITVVQNAYIPAGNYTIPSGVTLLVPFDDAYTLRTTDPTHAYAAPGTPSVYVKLTIGANAHLTVGGSISVSSTSQGNQPYGGCVYGKYGQIDMESGSTITLNSGANLYCWGYITGKGEITAKSGSKVYEDFQIACWRGGSAAWSISGNSQKVFPLAQYYIQNIEAKLRVESGATEYVWTSVSASNKAQRPENPITLIGESSGLFQIASGSLTKWFDAVNDRQMYEIEGNTALGAVSMHVYITITSTDYVLPLTNNMDITIKSGTLSCSNDVAILPGASIRIDEGAKVSITGDIFFYDKDEWPADGATAFNYNNVSFKKVNYTATPITSARTYANMKDAILDVNGTFETNGKFYTTAGGADICSSKGTGVVKYTGTSGSASATYQATQSGTSISYTTIPVTAARLHNSDDSYTLTVGSVSGDKYIYNKNLGQWMKNPKTITWDANGGVSELTTTAYSEGSFLGELPAATKDGYDLVGWFTSANGGTEISASTKVTATTTYYAHWTPKTYTITYKNQGESTFAGSTHIDTPNEHPTTHTFGTPTKLNGATRTHYTFGGWYKTVSCTGTQVTTIAASECKNITLYAKWIPLYTLTVEATPAGYGTVSKASVADVPEGSAVTTSDNTLKVNGTTVITASPSPQTAQYTYAFDHWNNVPATVTTAATIQAVFTRATRSYDVTFNMNGHGSAIDSQTKEYGSKVDQPSDPSETGYTFGGWYKEEACTNAWNFATDVVTGETTLFAKWIPINYTITFDSNGGSAVESITQGYGTDVTAPAAPSKTGYTFNGWSPAVPSTMPLNGTTCVAQWTANTNTPYIVKHYKQQLDGTYSATPDETDNLTGTTATEVTPSVKSYTGFDAPAAQTKSILADGSLVVTYKYKRKSYGLSWVTDGDALTGSYTHGETKFGATITAPNTPTKTGYTFNGWTPAKAETMPAAATTYTATWTANTNTAYTVEHYWQNIADNEYTKHETVNMTGTTDAATAAVAKSYTGFEAQSFSQGTIAPNGSTVVKIYYNRETYLIKWDVKLNGKQEAYKEETLRYGAMPLYGADPTKEQNESQVFSFSGWNPTPYAVDKAQTYEGSFDVSPRPYTITFVNDNGYELQSGKVNYGDMPTYTGTPVSTENSAYEFIGWTPAITKVSGETTYTATYRKVISDIVVNADENETISISASTGATTVRVSGSLSIEEGKTLKTKTLVLEASPGGSGQISGNIDAEEAYLDYNLGSSQSGLWYDIAVPWEVDVTNGVYLDGDTKPKQLNKDFYLIYYNGDLRARENGHTDKCWQFVGRESTPDNHMHPGRLYMIYMPKTGVNKLRFKRHGNGPIVTPEIHVYQYDAENVVNAGWNGIANPTIYKAYLNAGANTVEVGGSTARTLNYGQKYDPIHDRYDAFTMNNTKLNVSQPVFVQVEVNGNGTGRSVVVNASVFPNLAPVRKALVNNAAYEVQISAGANYTDRIYLQTVEGKEDSYRIGLDLSKAGTSSKVAQMWINRYNTKLCVNTTAPVGTTANYPLGISVPSDGTYEITSATEMQDGQEIYVTYNGRAIWNLAYGPYSVTLNKGTYNEYGLKLVQKAPTITTGVETVSDERLEGSGVRKVLIDNTIYIIREGAVYTINGQQVK